MEFRARLTSLCRSATPVVLCTIVFFLFKHYNIIHATAAVELAEGYIVVVGPQRFDLVFHQTNVFHWTVYIYIYMCMKYYACWWTISLRKKNQQILIDSSRRYIHEYDSFPKIFKNDDFYRKHTHMHCSITYRCQSFLFVFFDIIHNTSRA